MQMAKKIEPLHKKRVKSGINKNKDGSNIGGHKQKQQTIKEVVFNEKNRKKSIRTNNPR